MLLAATTRGVCFLSLGSTDRALEKALRQRCPGTHLVQDDAGLAAWRNAVVRYLEGQPLDDLPVDVEGTPFQKRAWQEVCRIPRGRTASYSDVARRMGRPTAVRAVARACATNPVALLVPCHRVISADGSLGGYGLGLDRKRRLLEMEQS
jgi:AraC family transcriptional regulator of adaptative response/methylated-DNA-[protein]-cysteine methyltransferase